MILDTDIQWMRHAIRLAQHGRGFVEPNPMVGAVVLSANGELVGAGWHERFGNAHAEVNAFAAAGSRVVGGTLVVTLEPCCHFGKTPPCTDVVLKSGVKRVVVAMSDPFPNVAGRGIAMLRNAGVEVIVGVCEADAVELNAAYLKRIHTGRPWVHLKWAMTLDGQIATRTGDSQWISSDSARAVVHELRGRMDAIVVGRGTVVADDPLLTARPPDAAQLARTATRVIVSASGELPQECRLLRSAREAPVLVFTSPHGASKLTNWHAAGAEVLEINTIEEVFTELGRRTMTNVLVEGGAGLLGSCRDADIGDELHVFVGPQLVGGGRFAPMGGEGVANLAEASRWTQTETNILGDTVYLRMRRA
jgi:diaminohydroxyphosphoribosylaminopyrimidine deaminase / 5-amino-6-(5-phosphoribosylamino)uracil reductase